MRGVGRGGSGVAVEVAGVLRGGVVSATGRGGRCGCS